MRLNRLFLRTGLCAALALAAGALSVPAKTVTVNVGGAFNIFTPPTTNIAVNDSVLWQWVGGLHSSTSDTGLWDSATLGSGTFSRQFTSSGTFPYHCTPHAASGMVGSIVVAAAAVPPSVTITNPANGTILGAPASLLLRASASDTDGSVTNVQFLQGTNPLGNDNSSPYSMPVNSLAAGNYTFSAVAADNSGLKATNSISIQVVTPVSINLISPQRLSSSAFRFSYPANVGLSYVVERSADLFKWLPINTNVANSNPVTFTDGTALGGAGYYRVGRQPNP
jgi:plastocyanin